MPTVTIGGNSTDTFSGCEDTRISNSTPTTNYGSESTISVAKFVPSDWHNSLLRFTGLSNISGPVVVSSATLHVFLTEISGDGQQIAVKECLRNWNVSQATWNVYTTGNNWTTAGCMSDGNDRVAVAVASSASLGSGDSGAHNAFTGAGLAALVQDIINGSKSNLGILLERSDGFDDSKYTIWGSTDGVDLQRPYLEVTYTAAEAAPVLMAQACL